MLVYLQRDFKLENIEHRYLWSESVQYCEANYSRNFCLNSLLRLMSQAWYLCSFIEQLPPYNGKILNVDLDFIKWTRIINTTLETGDKYFSNNLIYQAMTGTLMIHHPEFFTTNAHNFLWFTKEGVFRLHQACETDQKLDAFLRVERTIPDREANFMFPGQSEVDLYFKFLCRSGND